MLSNVNRPVRLTYYSYIVRLGNHYRFAYYFISLVMPMLPDAHFDDPLLNDAFDFSRYPTFKARNTKPSTVRLVASIIPLGSN